MDITGDVKKTMRKIRVLHKINSQIGGVEKYVFNNLKYIDRNKFEFDVLTTNKEIINTEEFRQLNFGVKNYSLQGRNDKQLMVKEINKILDDKYDVIHLHTSRWTGFLLEEIAIKRKIPKIIVHSHLSGISGTSSKVTEEVENLHNYYKSKFNEDLATDFCACSKSSAEWLFGNQIENSKIQIMKNAIDVDKYVFNNFIRTEVRRRLGLEDCFVLGHVGRMAYQKNHEFLIDTFFEVYKKNKKARLLLIGNGELEDSLKERVNKYGLNDAVLFGGWQNDVSMYLQAMDLFLLPSHYEGFPIVLVEAQTAGLKCIASSNITDEVMLTENIKFLELIREKWVDGIVELSDKYERINMSDLITEKGYNIKFAVKDLEKLYEL